MKGKGKPVSERSIIGNIVLLGTFVIVLLLLVSDWKEQAYRKRVIYAMDVLTEEGKTYSEELETAMRENIQLLEAVREAALALPEKNASPYDSQKKVPYCTEPSEIRETFAASPELVELLESMPEAGLDWQYLQVFPGGQSISFDMLRDGDFGGSQLSVVMNSPPLDAVENSGRNVIQVTDNWGIYWSVGAMAGI